MINRFTGALLASTILAAFAASPAAAQTRAPAPVPDTQGADATSSPAPDKAQLEQIIVTARKRSEALHDVPISIGAVGGETLHEENLKRLADIQFKVPNLTIAENPVGTTISIRGIFSGTNQGFEQSVGIYVDGIHYGRAQQSRMPFLDVERVEVLRGPQSILFGKNAIAGALNITTATPKSHFGAYVIGDYSPEHDEWETAGAVWGPLSDKVRVRLAGRFHQTDGYMTNLTLHRPEAQRDDWQLRGVVEADLTERLTVSAKAEAGRFDVTGRELEPIGNDPSVSANPLFAGLSYAEILTNTGAVPVNARIAGVNAATGMQLMPLPAAGSEVLDMVKNGRRHSNGDDSNNRSQTYVFKADYNVDHGVLTAISGYNHFKYDEMCDCDMTGAKLLTSGLQETYKQFSQEIRYVSEKGHRFDVIAGGFFQWNRDDYADQINIAADSPLVPLAFDQAYAQAYQPAFGAWLAAHPGDVPGAIAAGRAAGNQAGAAGLALANTRAARHAKVDADIWSAFGQLTWNATPRLHINFGGRLNYEKKNGRRDLEVEGIDGAPLTGLQALVAPLAYAGAFKVTSTNLNAIAAAGIPGISNQAAADLTALGTLPVTDSLSKRRFTPSLVTQYEPSRDVMLYASFTMGAKSGGFDYRANNKGASATMEQAFEFADEKATNYETGAKLRFLGGRAELNSALYYTDYKDLQISVFDGVLGFNVGNAAEARVYGLEADARLAVTRHLSARSSFAWTDFKFKDYKTGQCFPGQTADVTDPAHGLCDFTGKTNQLVAKYSGTAAIDYRTPLTRSLELMASTDLFYTSKYYAAPTLDPRLVQNGFAKVNARIGVGAPGRWEVAVLGKNLTNRKPLNFADVTPLAYSVFGAYNNFELFGEGRTFVLQGRLEF
jgi:outer membrane receptor protein involved in Fe transport